MARQTGLFRTFCYAMLLALAGCAGLPKHVEKYPTQALADPGSTPLGLYAELVERLRAGTASLDAAMIFNLDEYCGLAPSDPHSYAAFLRQHLIAPAGLAADQVRLSLDMMQAVIRSARLLPGPPGNPGINALALTPNPLAALKTADRSGSDACAGMTTRSRATACACARFTAVRSSRTRG